MAEVPGEGSIGGMAEMAPVESGSNAQTATPLTVSASFKEGGRGSSSRRRASVRPSLDADEFINLLHGSDPVKLELNRLENEVKDKERELGEAQSQIKALRLSERLREKAVEEVLSFFYFAFSVFIPEHGGRVARGASVVVMLDLQLHNLDIKRINDEKKASMAAQFAAEATLRRVHAAQKDDDMPPIEAILAPLEAELKLARQEIAKLQDDNKALDRLTKSKEAALLEAERTVQVALAKASMVDDLQNKNQELMKQIEICQEENKILDKMHRQKVAEVEKLTQTVRELEEAVLAGGAAANAVRDYQRKVQEMNGEMQQLKDKLAVSERTAKSEAQLKEKYQLRLKVLEETLRSPNTATRSMPDGRSSNGVSRRQSLGGAENISKLTSNGFLPKRSPSFQIRSSGSSTVLKHAKGTSKSFDGGSRSSDRAKILLNGLGPNFKQSQSCDGTKESETQSSKCKATPEEKSSDTLVPEKEDTVPGLLYDLLQKEVVSLRKAGLEKDQSLKDKDDAIEMLAKKVETLTKAMEVEAKKMRREVAAMEKEVAAMRVEKEHENRAKRLGNSKSSVSSQVLPGRSVSRSGSMRSTQ
ncbi:microtubule-associated protein 70-2 [Striga asiatica]|uniref:Microtubule-associated protein 70-2 n=1 Tax=Striga asiatica TaxID=4170 RepID=A0A5A7PX30_STRAF|nr:microtubule-associated protein 70-2 [Striga asiatica]